MTNMKIGFYSDDPTAHIIKKVLKLQMWRVTKLDCLELCGDEIKLSYAITCIWQLRFENPWQKKSKWSY